MNPACPKASELRDFATASLPEADASAIADHLDQCQHCLSWLDLFFAEAESAVVARPSSIPIPEGLVDVAIQTLDSTADQVVGRTTKPRHRQIRPFEILETLGRGGMGIVYHTHDHQLNREVALKVLAPTLLDYPEACQRFLALCRRCRGRREHPTLMKSFMKIIYPFLILACNTLQAASLLQGPMVGHVDDRSAQIWCALDEQGEIEVRIGKDPSLKDARTISKKGFEMGSVSIDGLKADTLYYYQIQAHQYSKSDRSHFKTMKPSGESLKLRFLFSSCSGKTGSDEDATWRDISLLKDLDLILMLGDNHYADSTNPGVITKHYLSHRSIGGFKQTTSRIPTYGIWDDHDYGPNNSDGKTEGKEDSLQIFKAHWANPSYGENGNPGIYFTYCIGDIQFIMLDSRYHRTPNQSMASADPAKTLLGEKQFQWLEKTLYQSEARVKIVSCGSNFELQGSNDGFKGFKVEQEKVLDLFEQTEGVVLLSGDRHFTAGYHIGGKTIEITSGPLGSKTVRPNKTPDMFFKETEGKMFSIFEIDTRTETPKLKLEVYRAGAGLIRTMDFSWKQINGLETITQEN